MRGGNAAATNKTNQRHAPSRNRRLWPQRFCSPMTPAPALRSGLQDCNGLHERTPRVKTRHTRHKCTYLPTKRLPTFIETKTKTKTKSDKEKVTFPSSSLYFSRPSTPLPHPVTAPSWLTRHTPPQLYDKVSDMKYQLGFARLSGRHCVIHMRWRSHVQYQVLCLYR